MGEPLDRLRVAVVPGAGVVARWPGIVCVAQTDDAELLQTLLEMCAEGAGERPGRPLALRLAAWLGGTEAPGQDLRFGTVAATGPDQWAVFLLGAVDLVMAGGEPPLSGTHAAAWTDRLVPSQDGPVTLALGEGGMEPVVGEPATSGPLDLQRGIVPGGGAVLRPARVEEEELDSTQPHPPPPRRARGRHAPANGHSGRALGTNGAGSAPFPLGNAGPESQPAAAEPAQADRGGRSRDAEAVDPPELPGADADQPRHGESARAPDAEPRGGTPEPALLDGPDPARESELIGSREGGRSGTRLAAPLTEAAPPEEIEVPAQAPDSDAWSESWFAPSADEQAEVPAERRRPGHAAPGGDAPEPGQPLTIPPGVLPLPAAAPQDDGDGTPKLGVPRAPARADRILGVAPAEPPRPPLDLGGPGPAPAAGARQAATDQPQARGHLCSRGHLNDPRSHFCVLCGIRMNERTGVLVVAARPPLGLLVLDDGATYTVDAEYIVGRMPEADERVRSGELRALVMEDRSGAVSRVHAEIRVDGWDVVLVDSGSRNGTFIAGPDESGWSPLPARQSRRLVPGTRVRLGGRTFVFESPSGVR